MTNDIDYFKITEKEYQNIKSLSEYVYQLANNTLLETIQKENKEEEVEEEWITRYQSIQSLWSNHQTPSITKGIHLMRIDYAWDHEGQLKVLELNTSAQGGWMDQSTKPQLPYLETIGKPLPPPKDFLGNYLMKKLGKKILLLVYDKHYNKEDHFIVEKIKELGGECLLQPFIPDEEDEEKVKEDHMNQLLQTIHQFQPTGIHLKLSPRSIACVKQIYQIADLNLPLSTSFESVFLSGDKSFLQSLYKKDERNVIPKSFILDKLDFHKNLHLMEKNHAVLKPGDEKRGKDVILGKNCDDVTWKKSIQEAMVSDNYWIMQELCYLKEKKNRFEDLVCFIADGEVISIASRYSLSEIVNIHNGGGSQPCVIISD